MKCDDNGALPKLPSSIGGSKVYVPFNYGAMASIWLHYNVEPDRLQRYLPDSLRAARFQGHGSVNINLQSYAALAGKAFANTFVGIPTTNEIEVNILAYPEGSEDRVPTLSLKDYLRGKEQTKTVGNYRLHVPCDNDFAVQAGRQLYGEWNKFFAFFTLNIPVLNNPEAGTVDEPTHFDCYEAVPQEIKKCKSGKKDTDAAEKTYELGELILGVSIGMDLNELTASSVNASPVVNFGQIPKDGRLVASQRNFRGEFTTYAEMSEGARRHVCLKYGDPQGDEAKKMVADVDAIVGDRTLAAIQTFYSEPVIVENHPYYVDEIVSSK